MAEKRLGVWVKEDMDMLDGALVDRALRQTYLSGSLYAIVPLPALNAWVGWLKYGGGSEMNGRFEWWMCCFDGDRDGGARLAKVPVDGNGNCLLCLKPVGHEGKCGWV